MDVATLASAMGNVGGVDYAGYVSSCNDALRLADCTTVNRAAMFLAQIGAESVGLKYSEEIASGEAYDRANNPRLAAGLGNTEFGDGPRFKGRTFIQITGRHNYSLLSVWAHRLGLVPTSSYFVDNPTALALPQYVWLGPVWYWTVARSTLNELSDARDIEGATRAINGGLHNLSGRTDRWRHCLALGSAILPGGESTDSGGATPITTPTTPTPEDDSMSEAEVAELKTWMANALQKKIDLDHVIVQQNQALLHAIQSQVSVLHSMQTKLDQTAWSVLGDSKNPGIRSAIARLIDEVTQLQKSTLHAASAAGVDMTAITEASLAGSKQGAHEALSGLSFTTTAHGGTA